MMVPQPGINYHLEAPTYYVATRFSAGAIPRMSLEEKGAILGIFKQYTLFSAATSVLRRGGSWSMSSVGFSTGDVQDGDMLITVGQWRYLESDMCPIFNTAIVARKVREADGDGHPSYRVVGNAIFT